MQLLLLGYLDCITHLGGSFAGVTAVAGATTATAARYLNLIFSDGDAKLDSLTCRSCCYGGDRANTWWIQAQADWPTGIHSCSDNAGTRTLRNARDDHRQRW